MGGYVKKIALIRGIKSGFSADGGELSGLVKAEAYAGFLKAEVSLINFAPLTEGDYLFGITDGERCLSFTGEVCECEAELELERGFAFLVCFRHNGVMPVAAAVCGNLQAALPKLKSFLEEEENVGEKFDDEAIAEVNYYEIQTDEGGDAVCQTQEKKTCCGKRGENEADIGSRQKGEVERGSDCAVENSKVAEAADGCDFGKTADGDADFANEGCESDYVTDYVKVAGGLAGGNFYERMKDRVERIFADYPKDSLLESAMEGSRWAKIDYGAGKYYSFGVIEVDGRVAYICYGVPASSNCNQSLKDRAVYIQTGSGSGSSCNGCGNGSGSGTGSGTGNGSGSGTGSSGYYVLFQSAVTGVSVDVKGK